MVRAWNALITVKVYAMSLAMKEAGVQLLCVWSHINGGKREGSASTAMEGLSCVGVNHADEVEVGR